MASVKDRMLEELIQLMRRMPPCVGRDDHVETFNALMLPRAYVHVAEDGLVHVIVIKFAVDIDNSRPETFATRPLPIGVQHSADVIWRFDPGTGLWNTLKDKTGAFSSLCPIKCGGIPTVKAQPHVR